MAKLLEFYDMVGDGDGEVPLMTEPMLVPTLLVSGTHVSAEGMMVRLTQWDTIPATKGMPSETRPISRSAMQRNVAHDLMIQLQAVFAVEH